MWDINLPTHAWFSRSLSTLPLLPPHLGAWVSWWGVYFSIIQLYPYKSWLMLFPLGAMTPSPRAVAKTELDGTGPGFRSHRDQTTPWCHSCKKWFFRHQVEVFSGERVRKKESSNCHSDVRMQLFQADKRDNCPLTHILAPSRGWLGIWGQFKRTHSEWDSVRETSTPSWPTLPTSSYQTYSMKPVLAGCQKKR
jgi:hypothetical protein